MANKTITMAQAIAGQMYLRMYCLRMMELGVPLTINHHLAMHFAHMIKLFGPIYAWWLFAFERFNGMLEKVNHNGHDGGRIELTLMRNWLRSHLLYELLLALPENAHPHEVAMIDQIIENETRRGGMAVEIAIFRAEASVNNVALPKQLASAPLDLYKYPPLPHSDENGEPTEIYELLLDYVRTVWPDHQFQRQFDNDGE